MYTLDEVKNWIFFDIETAGEESSLEDLYEKNRTKALLWSKRCEYLRNRYPECAAMSDSELYTLKSGLHPEFSKIVCVCLGVYQGEGKAQVVGFTGEERDILSKTMNMVSKWRNNIGLRAPMMVGHNVKRFDVPVLCKRTLINKLELAEMFQIQNKKPWEIPFIDTAELWSFGAWQESFTSLDLLANVLGIESSKGDMHGDMVHDQYWKQGDIAKIKEYCQNDVIVTMNVILELSGLQKASFETAQRV